MQSDQTSNPSFKEWFEGLTPDLKKEIQVLYHKKMEWNWVLPLFIILWAGAAYLVVTFSSVFVDLLGYIVIGLCIHGMANLMHEGIHNNLFNNKTYNYLYGFVAGIPALFSITAYKVNHLIHHKYTGSEKDPDELFNFSKNKILINILFYLFLIVGIFLYLIHVPVNALRHGSTRERIKILLEYAIMIALYVTIITLSMQYNRFDIVLHCWLIPVLFAALFGNIRGWAEHMLTDKKHILLNTRTVTSNPVFSFLNINLNYHLEHHLFPAMPWYNLPKLHRLLLPEYNKVNATVYSSYLTFFFRAFQAGPYKVV